MKTKLIIASLTLLALGTLGSTALAASPIAPELRQAVDGVVAHGKLNVRSERVVTNERGRQDLVVFAKNASADVVDTYMAAFRSKKAMADGAYVIGYARQTQSQSVAFTMAKGDTHYVMDIAADGSGCRLAMWGTAFAARPSALPHRLPPAPHLTSSRNVRVKAL